MTSHCQQAIDLYQSGLSMNATARAVGVTGQTVRRWLEASGVSIRYSRPTYAAETRDRAIAMYVDEQLSCAAVARALGLKAHTVKQWVKDAAVMRTMSDAASLSVMRGDVRAQPALWFTSARTGEKHLAESRLEYLRMEQIDRDGAVAAWTRCRHRVPYVDHLGKPRFYVPDLIVTATDGKVWVEEVKAEGRIPEARNQAKFAAADSWCAERNWGFRIVCERDVGYDRRKASLLSQKDFRARENAARRGRWARETDDQRVARKAKNAAYAREWRERKRTQAAS